MLGDFLMKIEMIDDDRFVVYYSFILDDILEYDIEDIKVFIQLLVVRLKNKYWNYLIVIIE